MKIDSYSRLFRLAIAVSSLSLVCSAALLAWSWRSHRHANTWVRHSYETGLALSETLCALQDVDTGMRGYIVSDKAVFLAPYDDGAARVPGLLDRVTALTADNPRQQDRLATVRPLIARKLALSAELMRQPKTESTEASARLGETQALTEEIRQAIAAMQEEERVLLVTREQTLEAARTRQLYIFAGLLVIKATLAVALVWLGRRVAELKKLVTICAWTHKVRHAGEWMNFEEYLTRAHGLRTTHGISPAMAEKLLADFQNQADPVSPAPNPVGTATPRAMAGPS